MPQPTQESRLQPDQALLRLAKVEDIPQERRIRISIPGKMQEIAAGEPSDPIQVDVFLPVQASPEKPVEVVLSLHGQGANAEFDQDTAVALAAEGALVIAPTTSRRTAFNPEVSGDFEQWMKESFAGKGFADEVADFQTGIEVARAELRRRFGKRDQVKLTILGYSLGSAMAAELAPLYQPDQLILVAPPFEFLHETNQPLLGESTPQPDQVVEHIKGTSVTVIRGDQDPFISQEDVSAYTQHGGKVIEIPGAGHTFGKIPDLPGDAEDKRHEMILAIQRAWKER